MPIPFRFPIALVLSIVCLGAPAWADFQAGVEAYERGDYPTALSEFRPLAKEGDANAQYSLGVLYANGQGVRQDYEQARYWWEKAAAQGNAEAQHNLGVLYAKGQGVPQNYGQARQWYEKAAAQGVASAQYNLAVLYMKGQGVPQDYVQAHMWFDLSSANERWAGAKQRDWVAKRMTPAQITEAQRLAREWKPTMP